MLYGATNEEGYIVFKVEFYVEDKKLGQALQALAGVARGQPSVVPVVNATVENGHIKAEGPGGKMLDLFAMYVKKTKKEQLSQQDVNDFLARIGMSQSSKAYLVKQAVQAKLIKRTGKTSQTTYNVIRG